MEVVLQRGEMLVFKGSRQSWRVRCVSGTLWATQAGDIRDHLASAGGSLVLRGRGRIVVTALADAVLRLEKGAGPFCFSACTIAVPA